MPNVIFFFYHLNNFKNMSKLNYSQADMIVIARRFHHFATQDLADFNDFDTSINANYLANFDAAIITAENHPDDETVLDIQTGYTAALVAKEKDCRKAYQRLKIFVEKSFPNNNSVQSEFGINDYGSIGSIAELIKFMIKLVATTNKYSTTLMANAYPAADIANIRTLHDDLMTTMTAQEAYKNERLRLTKQRDELLMAVAEYVGYLGKIGKIIYEDNRPQYMRYLLPTTNGSSTPISRIAAEARIVIFANVTENDYYTLRVVTAGSNLKFYVAPNGSTSVPANAAMLATASSPTNFSITELGFDAAVTAPQSLFAYNPTAQEIGFSAAALS